jgi:hypothetical protein
MIEEREFFRIREASRQKEIKINSSKNMLRDQIPRPSLLLPVNINMVVISGKKITRLTKKKPNI